MSYGIRAVILLLSVMIIGCNGSDKQDTVELIINVEAESLNSQPIMKVSPHGVICNSAKVCFQFPVNTSVEITVELSSLNHSISHWSIDSCGDMNVCSTVLEKNEKVILYLNNHDLFNDTDNDGILDNDDAFPNDKNEWLDTDNDGIGDNSDDDRDGDGINNDYEEQLGYDPNDATNTPIDTDADAIPDPLDSDIDGDNVANELDAFPLDKNEQSDLDKDGIGDNSDDDRDGDGISNDYEQQVGSDPDSSVLTPLDVDSDGIPNDVDADIDGDGVDNESDKFPFNVLEDSDIDNDGIGDNSDVDRDGDGFSNEIEKELGTSDIDLNSQPDDLDGDKIADIHDNDIDGDGVVNTQDDFPQDNTQIQITAAINIDSPSNGSITDQAAVLVTGTIIGPITEIRIEDEIAVIDGNNFSATVRLREGANKLTAVGIFSSATGQRATNATKNVILDTTAPEIILSSIKDGMVTTSQDITIAGSLDDLRSNMSENTQPTVTVNGIEVDVIEQSFQLANYQLRPGLNVINVQATDARGNSKIEQRKVVFLKQAGQKIVELGGNNQHGPVESTLFEPLSIKLLDRNNLPLNNRAVTFKVTEGDGLLQFKNQQSRTMLALSNEQGIVQVDYKLGKKSGEGKHQVTVSSIGFPGIVIFSASATPSLPAQLSVARGNHQTGMMGALLPEPLIARVIDANGNPLPSVSIKYIVNDGGGEFLRSNGEKTNEITVISDYDGNVIQEFITGSNIDNAGYNSQIITASVVGYPELNTTFTANNLRAQSIDKTTITGLVLDNSNQPLPGVEVKIKGNSFNTRETVTDRQGLFTFTQAPVGTVHLVLDGSTSSREGEWPHLMFELVTISGQENSVGMPIYFPKVDYEGGKIAGEDKTVVIGMRDVAGAEVIIEPNSMTFPDGEKSGRVMFTQVQTDKVPMPAPNGSRFDVAWTLQPAGIHFHPPARVSLPNTFGGDAGEEMEMFSFDHDLMEWVSIGPGVVSDDGAKITSRLGHGIRHSGWGGAPPPPKDKCNVKCNSNSECVSKWKKSGSCSCGQKYLKDKVKKRQEPKDCKTLTCGGFVANDGETPDDTTDKGDCRTTICKNGNPSNEIDDSDLPDTSKDDDNKCKTCDNGDVVTDHAKTNAKFACSNKKGQGCFVCSDGRCEKPDCKASDVVVKTSVGVSNPIFKDFADNLDKFSNANPFINVSLSAVRSKIDRETGEECCNCDQEDLIGAYTKTTASIGGAIDVTGALGGIALRRELSLGLGLKMDLVFEMGGVIIRGKASVTGALSGKSTECEEEGCTEGRFSMKGEIFAGPSFKLEGDVESCGFSKDDCDKLLLVSSEANLGVTSGFSIEGTTYIGDTCTKASCAGASLDEGAALVNMELKILVGNVYEGSYKFERKHVLWDRSNLTGDCT